MEIISGKIKKAQRVVIYGVEGIGKTTLASKFPKPIFIDTEDSTLHLNVDRTTKPTSWAMLMGQVNWLLNNSHDYKSLIIDTTDWAELLCIEHICAKHQKNGIEDFGWGKGFTYLAEEFAKFLNKLSLLIDKNINVVLTAHSFIRKFEQPEETGAYDRYEMKLGKKTCPLVKEWCDMLLFCNYKTMVIEIDGKKKAQGGQRVIYTEFRPSWDAKNRHNLPEEMPMDYKNIAHCIPGINEPIVNASVQEDAKSKRSELMKASKKEPDEIIKEDNTPDKQPSSGVVGHTQETAFNSKLYDLMQADGITEEQIQWACSSPPGNKAAYYPRETPIGNYDEAFVNGLLIAKWAQVKKHILNNYTPY